MLLVIRLPSSFKTYQNLTWYDTYTGAKRSKDVGNQTWGSSFVCLLKDLQQGKKPFTSSFVYVSSGQSFRDDKVWFVIAILTFGLFKGLTAYSHVRHPSCCNIAPGDTLRCTSKTFPLIIYHASFYCRGFFLQIFFSFFFFILC